MFWRLDAPETVREVAERVPAVVVARAVYPETPKSPVVEAEARVALPVVVKVATWRLPVPVALVKVTPARADPPEMLSEAPEILVEA